MQLPRIISILPNEQETAIVVTVRKNNPGEAAHGDIYAYPNEEEARAHQEQEAHRVGSWSSPAEEDVRGTGTIGLQSRGKFLVVNQASAWSEPEQAGMNIG